VDLPGYGFAVAHASIRDTFGPMIEGYLQERAVLVELMVLIDVRRGAGQQDRQLLDYASQRDLPARIVGTKADKMSKSERGLISRKIANSLDMPSSVLSLTSASMRLGLGDEGRGRGLTRLLAERVENANC